MRPPTIDYVFYWFYFPQQARQALNIKEKKIELVIHTEALNIKQKKIGLVIHREALI